MLPLFFVESPETPTHFIVLNNSTSVALTLQWQPGLSGSHPPQVFTIQYMADTNLNLFHGRTITADDSTQQQVTITALEPDTLYKFTLYARSDNTDVIRSGVTTVSAQTTGETCTVYPTCNTLNITAFLKLSGRPKICALCFVTSLINMSIDNIQQQWPIKDVDAMSKIFITAMCFLYYA